MAVSIQIYAWLVLAILLEVCGTMMLPLTQNFTRLVPTAVLVPCYTVAIYLLTFVLRALPLSVVYATWSGLGIFSIAVLGYLFFGQALAWQVVLGLFFIILGVVLVNWFPAPPV